MISDYQEIQSKHILQLARHHRVVKDQFLQTDCVLLPTVASVSV